MELLDCSDLINVEYNSILFNRHNLSCITVAQVDAWKFVYLFNGMVLNRYNIIEWNSMH